MPTAIAAAASPTGWQEPTLLAMNPAYDAVMAQRRQSTAQGKSIASRLCPVCGRETDHEITEMQSGSGVRIAANSKCLEHREWANGRLEFLNPHGEWAEKHP